MASSGVDAVCPYCQVVLRPGLNHVCNPQGSCYYTQLSETLEHSPNL